MRMQYEWTHWKSDFIFKIFEINLYINGKIIFAENMINDFIVNLLAVGSHWLGIVITLTS